MARTSITARLEAYASQSDGSLWPVLRTEYGPFQLLEFSARPSVPVLYLRGTPRLLGRDDRRPCHLVAELAADGSWQLDQLGLDRYRNRSKGNPRPRAW